MLIIFQTSNYKMFTSTLSHLLDFLLCTIQLLYTLWGGMGVFWEPPLLLPQFFYLFQKNQKIFDGYRPLWVTSITILDSFCLSSLSFRLFLSLFLFSFLSVSLFFEVFCLLVYYVLLSFLWPCCCKFVSLSVNSVEPISVFYLSLCHISLFFTSIFSCIDFSKFQCKQAMLTLRGMAEHRYSNVC